MTPRPATVRVRALQRPPRVLITAAATATAHPAIERDWSARQSANPKLHDGPVLAVERLDGGDIHASRSSYKMFVSGHAGGVSVRSLGVTGVCIREHGGTREVLLGRRAPNVRIYGGTWETAPRGGVEPPAQDAMTADDLAACVLTEAREELHAEVRPLRWFAAVEDDVASSVDLCLLCAAPDASPANWEYTDHRWLPVAALIDWSRGAPPPELAGDELSPPCRALAAWEGWSAVILDAHGTR